MVFWASLAPCPRLNAAGRCELTQAEAPVEPLGVPVAVKDPEDAERDDQAHRQADQW
jgi:hypothetical protein